VATISRLLQIIGLFCKRAISKRLYSAKEIYKLKEPTNRSHPIPVVTDWSPLCSVNASRHTCEWDMSHICTSRVTHMNYEWVTSHMWMCHVNCLNETCHAYDWVLLLMRMRSVMSRRWMSHVTPVNESCHTRERVMERVMSHTWASHVIHMHEMYTYEWVMPLIWMNHVTSHIWMSHVTHMNESCHTYDWGMSHMN